MTTRDRTLAAYVEEYCLSHRFLSLGHISNPAPVLMAAVGLLSPTRDNTPERQDVWKQISTASQSRRQDTTVPLKPNPSGFLLEVFNVTDVANWLVEIYGGSDRLAILGKYA